LLLKFLYILFLIPLLVLPAFAQNEQILSTTKGTLDVGFSTTPDIPQPNDIVKLNIDFINPTTDKVQEHIDYRITVSKDGENVFGPILLTHTSVGSVTIPVELQDEGNYIALIEVEGILFQPLPLETVSFNFGVGEAAAQSIGDQPESNGGCLIATAAFGTELAPQVQMLRELRDNTVLSTASGVSFMTGFNAFYYSFSPTIADWERQNPMFQEVVRMTITPLISTLSILNYVDIDSDTEMLGYGIGIIMMNVGLYFVAPAIIILKLYKFRIKQ